MQQKRTLILLVTAAVLSWAGVLASLGAPGLARGQSPATRSVSSVERPRPLTAQQEREVLEYLKENREAYYSKLMELKGQDSQRYARAISRMHRFVRKWQRMPEGVRQAINEERELQVRIMALIRQMRQTEAQAERQKLSTELAEVVAQHFEAEQSLRERRLADLANQIKDLRKELDRQRKQRDEIIAERVARWLKAAEPVSTTQSASG